MKTCKGETPNAENLPMTQPKTRLSCRTLQLFPSTLDLSQGDYLCVRYALARRDIFFYIMMLKTAWPSTRKPGSTLSGNPRDHEGFACYHFRTGRTAVAFWWLFFTSHLNLPPVARKCARLCKSQPSSKALPFDLAVAPSY